MVNSAPWLPYVIVVPIAELHDAAADEPLVKSAVYDPEFRAVSSGQVFFVGSQLVDVCATAIGIEAARAAALEREKRIVLVFGWCSFE